MTQQWNPTGGGFDVEPLENINEVADLPDLAQLDEAQIYSIRSGEFAPDYVVPWDWDATAEEYQEWRSTVDGQVIRDIPDSGVYLDDWFDNRISNRETYSDLQYEFFDSSPVESGFDTEPERPEWTELQSTVTTSEGRVEFNDDDAERLGTSLPVDSLPDELYMRMDFEMQNTTTRSGRSMFFASVNETEDEDIPKHRVTQAPIE